MTDNSNTAYSTCLAHSFTKVTSSELAYLESIHPINQNDNGEDKSRHEEPEKASSTHALIYIRDVYSSLGYYCRNSN